MSWQEESGGEALTVVKVNTLWIMKGRLEADQAVEKIGAELPDKNAFNRLLESGRAVLVNLSDASPAQCAIVDPMVPDWWESVEWDTENEQGS